MIAAASARLRAATTPWTVENIGPYHMEFSKPGSQITIRARIQLSSIRPAATPTEPIAMPTAGTVIT